LSRNSGTLTSWRPEGLSRHVQEGKGKGTLPLYEALHYETEGRGFDSRREGTEALYRSYDPWGE